MNRTKHAIVATFWQLLEEKTYNKITVQDIVDRCHVNRNTFYYHFQDIPSLAEWSVEIWADEVIKNRGSFDYLHGRRRHKEEKGAFTSFSFCKKRVFLKVPKQNGIPCYLYLRRKQNRKSFTCRK